MSQDCAQPVTAVQLRSRVASANHSERSSAASTGRLSTAGPPNGRGTSTRARIGPSRCHPNRSTTTTVDASLPTPTIAGAPVAAARAYMRSAIRRNDPERRIVESVATFVEKMNGVGPDALRNRVGSTP